MDIKIIWTYGLFILFLKGCFNARNSDEHVTLLDNVMVWKDSCVMLPCEYRGSNVDKFIWYYNATYDKKQLEFNGTIVYSKGGDEVDQLFAGHVQYGGENENTDCSIVIKNIKKEHEGIYNLRLLGKNFKWMSRSSLIITVSDIGLILKIHPIPEIKELENITLTCSISYYCPFNNISLHWIEEVNGLSTTDVRYDPNELRTTSSLMFRPSWKDNRKNITCILNRDNKEADSATVQLNVIYAPKNVQVLPNSTIIKTQKSQPLTLNCSVESSNPPDYEITWFKDNLLQQQNHASQFQVINSGKYFCKAKNKIGETTSNQVEVSVLYAPDKPVIKKSLEIIKEGMDITMECSTIANLTVFHYIWFKDGEECYNHTSDRFTIYNIKEDNSGSYTCLARNELGEIESDKLVLNVMYAPRHPRVVLELDRTMFAEEDIIFVEGDRVTFQCNVNSSNPAMSRITWYKDGKQIENFNKSVKAEDAGNYSCEAENSIGRTKSPAINVDIHYAPDKPIIKKSLEIIKEGMNITMECSTIANPPVFRYVWFKDGEKCYNHTSDQFTIYNIKKDNSGSYTCLARNDLGEIESDPLNLNVMYVPRHPRIVFELGRTIFAEEDKTIFVEGDNVSFRCNVNSSNPTVSRITWYKDGKKIENISKAVKAEDAGNYSCEAENSIGRAKSPAVNVDIHYPPKGVDILISSSAVKENETIRLKCLSKTSKPKINRYEWYKDGALLRNSTSDVMDLRLKWTHTGEYFCKALNNIGAGESTKKHITVQYAPDKPVIKKSLEIIKEGMDITMECSSIANLTVFHYIWFKDGEECYNHTSDRFTIYNIKKDNSGTYTCLASSKLGEIESDKLDLNVMYAPQNVTLSVSPGDHVTEYMDVKLICTGNGHPAGLHYEFYLNDVPLSSADGSFDLNGIQIKDSGEYFCLARNLVGDRRSNVISLHVSYSPGTIGKFASIGASSFIVLLILIFLTVHFRVRITNALCRKEVDDNHDSSLSLKKYENIVSSKKAHEDSQDEKYYSIITDLNKKTTERENNPEVEYAKLRYL